MEPSRRRRRAAVPKHKTHKLGPKGRACSTKGCSRRFRYRSTSATPFVVRQDAQRELRPEIFARITVTVVFNKLGYEAQCAIAGGMIAKECAALTARGFAITPEDQVSEVVIQRGYHERLGARPMRDATELLIRNALAQELLRGGDGTGRLVPHSDGQQLQLTAAAS